MRLRAADGRLGRPIGRDHARRVAAIEQGGGAGLAHHADGAPGLPEIRIVNDVQQFRQAGIFVAAQRRIQHMIRQDARVFVVEPGAAHRGFPQCARCLDRQVDAVVAGPVGHRSIPVVGSASVPRDRGACPGTRAPHAPGGVRRFRNEATG